MMAATQEEQEADGGSPLPPAVQQQQQQARPPQPQLPAGEVQFGEEPSVAKPELSASNLFQKARSNLVVALKEVCPPHRRARGL